MISDNIIKITDHNTFLPAQIHSKPGKNVLNKSAAIRELCAFNHKDDFLLKYKATASNIHPKIN